MKQAPQFKEIHEGNGTFPWWVWIAVWIWIVYAFFLGPFHWFPPQG
ncbi:MAG TPA: hypothetical protein VIL47_04210 [Candidatus Bipolaricaulota bacterium]